MQKLSLSLLTALGVLIGAQAAEAKIYISFSDSPYVQRHEQRGYEQRGYHRDYRHSHHAFRPPVQVVRYVPVVSYMPSRYIERPRCPQRDFRREYY